MKIQPYLFFDGRCEEAIEFYRKSLGAKVEVMLRFTDAPDPAQCQGIDASKVMHAQFTIGDSTVLASDGHAKNNPRFEGVSLNLMVPTVAEAEKLFAALSEGGQVQMPLSKTFYSPMFGMTADRFGVSWMVYTMPNA